MSGQDWEEATLLLTLDTSVGRRYASTRVEVLKEILDVLRAGGSVHIIEARFVADA
jgi:hypothetical protein